MAANTAQVAYWRLSGGDLVIRVHLTPRARHDRIDGLADDGTSIRMRVRAIPEDGKANAALEDLVADWLDIAGGRVSVTGGATSRHKSVTIAGADADLVSRLQILITAES